MRARYRRARFSSAIWLFLLCKPKKIRAQARKPTSQGRPGAGASRARYRSPLASGEPQRPRCAAQDQGGWLALARGQSGACWTPMQKHIGSCASSRTSRCKNTWGNPGSPQGRARQISPPSAAFPVQYGHFCFANQKKSARKRANPLPKGAPALRRARATAGRCRRAQKTPICRPGPGRVALARGQSCRRSGADVENLFMVFRGL